jgi:hypothetical protein
VATRSDEKKRNDEIGNEIVVGEEEVEGLINEYQSTLRSLALDSKFSMHSFSQLCFYR